MLPGAPASFPVCWHWFLASLDVGVPGIQGITKVLILKWGTSKPRPGLVQVVGGQIFTAPISSSRLQGSVSEEEGEMDMAAKAGAAGVMGAAPTPMET